LRLEQVTESHHGEHVDPHGAGGQGTVDKGAVYDHVHVVEVVTKDGDIGKDRNRKLGQCANENDHGDNPQRRQ
jgi:hypothetical protein